MDWIFVSDDHPGRAGEYLCIVRETVQDDRTGKRQNVYYRDVCDYVGVTKHWLIRASDISSKTVVAWTAGLPPLPPAAVLDKVGDAPKRRRGRKDG